MLTRLKKQTMLSDFSDASRAVQGGLGRALFIEVADVAGVAEV